MQLTDEQASAVDLFKTSKSLKISAFAGTGKTSTLVGVSKATNKSGLYLAFNRSIADEAQTRFSRSVACKTTHSLALASVPAAYRGNKEKLFGSLPGNKVAKLLDIQELSVAGVNLKARSLGYLTAKTVTRFCQSGDEEISIRHVPLSGKLNDIEERYQNEFKVYVGKMASHLWRRMLDPSDPAPLGHDGYLKLWSLSRPQLEYDYVLLDEAQDTNEAVLSVLRAQDNHLTLVGDRHQQIYEWRGAVNAMASVETHAEAALTRSFRFGDTVAAAATTILRTLGEQRTVQGDPRRSTRIAAFGRTQTVLCRTNAGVVSTVVSALARGQRPHVVGGVLDLIRMLEDVTRLKNSEPADCPEFFGFKNWDEVLEFSTTEEGESLRSFVKIVAAHGEVALIQRLQTVCRDEADADLIVSTAHKAKGREWESVTLAGDFEPRVSNSVPPKPVLNPEEARLLYVAVTRAKDLLVVPPRLAERWNVVPAPPDAESEVEFGFPSEPPGSKVAAAAPVPAKPQPMPELPPFAKVVAAPKIESTARPRPAAPAGAVKATATSAKPQSLRTPSAQPSTKKAQPGLLSLMLAFLTTKK